MVIYKKGEFCIICNQLEYSLSFVVSIIRPYGNASTGRIRNLSDFIKLAQTDYMEAYRLFASQGFQHVLKEEKRKRTIMVCRLWRTGSIDFRYGGVLGYDQCQTTH